MCPEKTVLYLLNATAGERASGLNLPPPWYGRLVFSRKKRPGQAAALH